MLDSLRFVQGAVAKKDFVPALTHFQISDGKIKGYNGMLALCSPIEIDLDVSPKAVPFVKALQLCGDEITLFTQKDKLVVKSGSFKALIECSPDPFPNVVPEGQAVELGVPLLNAFRRLAPFISEDASRPWSRGILLRGQSAFATNNICLVEHWLDSHFPVEACIPHAAVTEVLRIGEEPESISVSENNLTFFFKGERWLRTQLLDLTWPDISRILDMPADDYWSCCPAFFDAVEKLRPFVESGEAVYFVGDKVATGPTEAAASVELPDFPFQGCYGSKYLMLLKPVADKIAFSNYPNPASFYGDKIRGVILGRRQ